MQKPDLLPFQRRFIARATSPEVDVAALSLPRGNGKSWLAGHLVSRILNPRNPLFRPGAESVLLAASIEQARIVFRFARGMLGEPGYDYVDSANRVAILHRATRTRLRVIGSNARTAFGLVDCPFAICDEPGAWEVRGGEFMNDALQTSLGKPGSPLKIIYIGTVAPARRGWWPELIERGTVDNVYVQALQGRPERWDDLREVRRVNPLIKIDQKFADTLRRERNAALADSRLKAQFLSYRLNVPSGDSRAMLLDLAEWQAVLQRPVAPRQGQPVVGVDLGHSRSWSAAVALWPTGRVEAVALAPGIPSVEAQEKRDRVPKGTYGKLVDEGKLVVAEGLRVQPVEPLMTRVRAWNPDLVLCDRFRVGELRDHYHGPVRERIARWSEASEDIRGFRQLCLDGPLAPEPESRGLLDASLAASEVATDDQGSQRLIKPDSNRQGRDDVAAAAVLAAGEMVRRMRRPMRALEFEVL